MSHRGSEISFSLHRILQSHLRPTSHCAPVSRAHHSAWIHCENLQWVIRRLKITPSAQSSHQAINHYIMRKCSEVPRKACYSSRWGDGYATCVRGNHGATKHRDSWALGRWLAPAMSQRLTALSRQRTNAHTCKSPGLRYNTEVLTRAIHEKETASPQWNRASVLNVAWGTLRFFFLNLLTRDLRCNWSIFSMINTIFSLKCW